MGLFTKMDVDGLPLKYYDLLKETDSKKANKDPAYKRKVLEKLKLKGVELWKQGKMTGWSEYNLGGTTLFLPQLEHLQECYEAGLGGSVDKKAAFECLMLRKELMEEYCKKNALSLEDINSIPYIWESIAYHYMIGDGCEKDNSLRAKYVMMAFQGWAKHNDEYGISGANLIRRLMSGYPYPMMDLNTYTLMAASLRSRGAKYGAFVMQEIESMAQIVGKVSYKNLGNSLESDLAILNEASAMGNAFANYRLGLCYKDGRGVPKDEKKAIAYLEKAAETLVVAANALFDIYAWKDSKAKTQEDRWAQERAGKQQTKLEQEALAKYTVDYIKAFNESVTEDTDTSKVSEAEEEHKGKHFTDSESPFTILDLPDVITGPYNVTYRKESVSTYSADYLSDHGERATIHVADIGVTGRSAQNSFGYFYW